MKKLFLFLLLLTNIVYADANEELFKAITKEDIKNIKLQMAKGAKLEARLNANEESDMTPLIYSVNLGNYEITKFFIELGADVNAQDGYGVTSLMYASLDNNVKIAKLLIEKGANINMEDSEGANALMKAALNDSYDVAELLIEKGADVNEETSFGLTPMIYGVQGKDKEYSVIKLLIKKGADINKKSEYNGDTALMHIESVEGAKVLLDKGAKINEKNNKGMTPLSFAVKFNKIEIAKYLILRGADTMILNKEGKSLMELAKSEEMKKVLNKKIEYSVLISIIRKYNVNKEITIEELENAGIKEILREKPTSFTDGQYISILNDYAYFLSETERYKEAIPILERVIVLAPNRVVAYLNLGDCYYKEYKK